MSKMINQTNYKEELISAAMMILCFKFFGVCVCGQETNLTVNNIKPTAIKDKAVSFSSLQLL